MEEIAETARETPLDVGNRDIVPAVGHPLGHTQLRKFHIRKCEIEQLNPPPSLQQAPNKPQIGPAGECGFKREIFPVGYVILNLAQKLRIPSDRDRSFRRNVTADSEAS